MPAPQPTRLFHITAIANLQAIFAAGALVSKNGGAAAGINYQNIAHAGAQGARAVRAVPERPIWRIGRRPRSSVRNPAVRGENSPTMTAPASSNFSVLAAHDEQFVRLGRLPANARDVGQQGHRGTGDLELALTSQADLDSAKPLILMAYEGRGAIAA